MMLKINFTLVIGSCLHSSGVAVQCGVLLQPMVVKDICIKLLFLVHPRCWFCATEVTSNIVFNCYLCLCSLPLYIGKEQKKLVIWGGLCQTNNKPVQDGGMRKGWGSGSGVFGYDLLKEGRYIFNEYAVHSVKICC
jgi:hypothetical protein